MYLIVYNRPLSSEIMNRILLLLAFLSPVFILAQSKSDLRLSISQKDDSLAIFINLADLYEVEIISLTSQIKILDTEITEFTEYIELLDTEIKTLKSTNNDLSSSIQGLNENQNTLEIELSEVLQAIANERNLKDSLVTIVHELQQSLLNIDRQKIANSYELESLKLHENSVRIPAKLISIGEGHPCGEDEDENAEHITLKFSAPFHGGTYYANLPIDGKDASCSQTATDIQHSDFVINYSYFLYIGLQFWGFDTHASLDFGAVYIEEMTIEHEIMLREYYGNEW
jgi:FtsZ-binding cell division protein ZapB